MLIAQISDTHIVTEGPAAEGRKRDLERAVAAIGRLSPAPRLILHSGDVAHNGRPSEYALARQLLDPLRLPVLAVPGNRDNREHLLAAFPPPQGALRRGRFMQYAFDAGPARIVAADTRHDSSGLGAMDPVRLADLKSLLEQESRTPIVVLLHHPPALVAGLDDPHQFKDPGEVDRLAATLAARREVMGVLAGHIHRHGDLEIAGVPLRVMPSIAVDLRKEPSPTEHAGRPLVHLHTIEGRIMTTRVIVA